MTQKYDLNFQIIVINMQVSNSQKWGFPDGSVVRNPGDPGSIPGLGIFPREGNDNPLWFYCLEKSHGQRSLAAIVHGVTKVSNMP